MIHHQVKEFHNISDTPTLLRPQVPPKDRVRLRARLITEEYIELMKSLFVSHEKLDAIEQMLEFILSQDTINVNLPEFADATCDLDYVVEGSRLEFGIDGYPIAKAIHEANMKKLDTISKRRDGKITKPVGWQPADISKLLKEQGWEPSID